MSSSRPDGRGHSATGLIYRRANRVKVKRLLEDGVKKSLVRGRQARRVRRDDDHRNRRHLLLGLEQTQHLNAVDVGKRKIEQNGAGP